MKKKIQIKFLDQLRNIQDKIHDLSDKIDGIFDEYEVPVKIDEIKKFIEQNKSTNISISWLQRRYKIGFARAMKLLDILKKQKIIK